MIMTNFLQGQHSVALLCPRCQVLLRQKSVKKVFLDECPLCSGYWFDRWEIDQFKSGIDERLRYVDVDLWHCADMAQFRPAAIDCPRCQSLMSQIKYGASDVEVEYCINCCGTWLDAGKDKRVIQFSQIKADAMSLNDLRIVSVQQFKEILAGPKGFIEESRDFIAVVRRLCTQFWLEHPKMRQALSESGRLRWWWR